MASSPHSSSGTTFSELDLISLAIFSASPLFLFFGVRLYKLVVSLLGAFLGGYFAYFLVSGAERIAMRLLSDNHLHLENKARIITMLIFAAVGAMLLLKLTRLGIFTLGALAFLMIGNGAFHFASSALFPGGISPSHYEWIHVTFMLAFCAFGGYLAVYFVEKVLVRISTSLLGAYMFVGSSDYALKRFNITTAAPLSPEHFFSVGPEQFACSGYIHCYALVLLLIVLWIAGMHIQFRNYPSKELKKRKDSDPPDLTAVEKVYEFDSEEPSLELTGVRVSSRSGKRKEYSI